MKSLPDSRNTELDMKEAIADECTHLYMSWLLSGTGWADTDKGAFFSKAQKMYFAYMSHLEALSERNTCLRIEGGTGEPDEDKEIPPFSETQRKYLAYMHELDAHVERNTWVHEFEEAIKRLSLEEKKINREMKRANSDEKKNLQAEKESVLKEKEKFQATIKKIRGREKTVPEEEKRRQAEEKLRQMELLLRMRGIEIPDDTK